MNVISKYTAFLGGLHSKPEPEGVKWDGLLVSLLWQHGNFNMRPYSASGEYTLMKYGLIYVYICITLCETFVCKQRQRKFFTFNFVYHLKKPRVTLSFDLFSKGICHERIVCNAFSHYFKCLTEANRSAKCKPEPLHNAVNNENILIERFSSLFSWNCSHWALMNNIFLKISSRQGTIFVNVFSCLYWLRRKMCKNVEVGFY